MPGCFQSRNSHFADSQLETVLYGDVRKSSSCLRSDVNEGAGSRGQLLMPGNEVGVKVSLEDMANGNMIRLGSLKINFDVTLRIDDHSLTLGRHHVGRMRQTAEIKLFKVHRSPPSADTYQFYPANNGD